MRRRTQRGFSVIELMTVLSIVTVAMTAAFPAMMQARSRARLVTCKNNLKMVGLALHNYHDVYNCFPPGWTSNHAKPAVQAEWGWQASILPFIDYGPLYEELDFNRAPELSESLQINIAELRCPSDRTPTTNPLRGNFGTSNYSGNYGDTAFRRWLPGRFSQYWPGQADSPLPRERAEFITGVFWRNSRSRIADMLDGTSNTIMVAERSFEFAAGIWVGVGDHSMETDQLSDGSFASPLNRSLTGFSSSHNGGVNILLGDGSVHFLSETIESAKSAEAPKGTLQKLTNRRDGENVEF